MTTGARIRRTMLEALLALLLNLVLSGILFATKQTWLLPSQANASGILQLAGGDGSQARDLGLRGLGAPAEGPASSLEPAPPGTSSPEPAPSSAGGDLASPLAVLSTNPWLVLLAIVVLFPLGEELVFRGLPMLLLWLSGRAKPALERANSFWAWGLGGVAALLFSLAHGIGSPGFHLPLPQLFLGVWLWWVATRRGLGFSILAHGTYNLIPGLLTLLLTNLPRA